MNVKKATLLILLLLRLPTAAEPPAVVESDIGFVLENEYLRLRVDRAGGRIAGLEDKRAGSDLVALWKGGGEIGGLLDDRLYFTSAVYEARVEQAAAEVALRLGASHASGLRLEKTLILRAGEPVVRVRYRLVNAASEAAQLWVRNFPMPGGPPLGEHHLYLLPRQSGTARQPFASEYFADLQEPWAALHDTLSGCGLLAVVPGVEQFYFWQGSRQYPTFEWLYPQTRAGRQLEVELALAVVHEPSPDWAGLARRLLAGLQPPRRTPVPGWRDPSARFGIDAADRRRGFWLSTGRQGGQQRLPRAVELDLPLDGRRSCYIDLNPLAEIPGARFSARLRGALAGWVELAWEIQEENVIAVEKLDGFLEHAPLPGETFRIWLTVDAQGRAAGGYADTLVLELDGQRVRVPLRVRVWPVQPPAERPFEVRGYATLTDLTGGYAVSDTSLRQLEALLGAYAQFGGSVFDWTAVWARVLEQVRLASTGELLTQVAREHPERLRLDDLPALDFSYYDPWLAAARRLGVDRVETYMDYPADERWQWACLDPAMGQGRIQAGTPAAEMVVIWLYGELRRYFETRGFRGFFGKIADEISPEHLPEYERSARLARRAGWRPFTTITGLVARTPEHLEDLNPLCDQWQVSLMLKDDFRALARPDAADEIWFYGGSSHPFRQSYESALHYPLLAAIEGVDGYGWWAFQWWQASEKVVWYGPESGVVYVGPTYLGLRDGWEDARLFHWVVRQLGALPPERAAGSGEGVLIRLAEETAEVYRWTDIADLQSPPAINQVRRTLLQAATDHLSKKESKR